jgi:RHH-type proline utilization regulon transcriptional repressor/proline dehydrogenase/delta 1-pyrroline-5-carboxylate dehydrogenase
MVVLTGGTATARLFHELRPGLSLAAETGGKNAIVVSALSDRDAVVQDVVYSAFGHAGQKCSACSLLICEAEVYDDPRFMETLRDAAASLPVGGAWDPRSFVTPLIGPARDPLLRGLSSLEPDESWLLEPRRDAENLRLWSPGIRLGVQEGSFTHVTELFGPHLSVMRADDLDHALHLANATPYGLTAGLHSLDESEQRRWARRMRAGNLYINRPITGAIVQRQPFGGMKSSSFGAGAKAGGPNYVLQLCQVSQGATPEVVGPPEPAAADLVTHVRGRLDEAQRERLSVGACDYGRAQREHFGLEHDPSQVLGERNVFRYVPCEPLLLRAGDGADPLDVLLACAAALTSGSGFELSLSPALQSALPYHDTLPGVVSRIETATECARHLVGYARIRALGPVEVAVATAAEAAAVHIAGEPLLLSGRVELTHYQREQSLSHRYHRHGNLAAARLL